MPGFGKAWALGLCSASAGVRQSAAQAELQWLLMEFTLNVLSEDSVRDRVAGCLAVCSVL